MTDYEYTVIPAPGRGEKIRGAKTSADRFCAALGSALNGMAAQGWEYVRAETLPSEERSGLTGRATVWNNVLVFRRALAQVQPQHNPGPAAPPVQAAARPAAQRVAAPPAQEPAAADWPDGGADDAIADGAGVDDYAESGFDPAPEETGGTGTGTTPPPFTRRPPLAAPREDEPRGVFSGAMSANRLGPAER